MIDEVTVYRTSDHVIYQTQEEANEHERRYQHEKLVDQYLEQQGEMKAATKTRAKKAILDFLDWRQD